jgi:hypothetical protein
MTATIVPHGAVIARCWFLQKNDAGGWFATLHSRRNGEEARTDVGTLYVVRETVRTCYAHRGLPVCWFPVKPAQGRGAA